MKPRSIARKVFGPRQIGIDFFLEKYASLPELRGYSIEYLPKSLDYPEIAKDDKKVFHTEGTLKPMGVQFGDDLKVVIKQNPRPWLVVDNSSQIAYHKIVIYKSRLEKYQSTSQLHFFDGKLCIVIDDFKKKYTLHSESYQKVLRILGLEKIDYGEKLPDPFILKDKNNNILSVDEGICWRVRYQCWK